MCAATSAAAVGLSGNGSAVPGTVGTPAAAAKRRAATLSPIAASTSGGGPMNTSPAASHSRAKAALSERNP